LADVNGPDGLYLSHAKELLCGMRAGGPAESLVASMKLIP
jgi:hypothetical protein